VKEREKKRSVEEREREREREAREEGRIEKINCCGGEEGRGDVFKGSSTVLFQPSPPVIETYKREA